MVEVSLFALSFTIITGCRAGVFQLAFLLFSRIVQSVLLYYTRAFGPAPNGFQYVLFLSS